MIFAQIKNNVVVNSIILDDPSLLSLFSEGFDECLRIDNIDPQPGKGWSYVDGAYSQPLDLELEGDE